MKTPSASLLPFAFVILFSISCSASADQHQDFVQCLSLHSPSITQLIYTPKNPSFQPILHSSIQNLRYGSPETPKPAVIVTPIDDLQIQSVIYCSQKHGLQVRVRSGGHDTEGLSFVSEIPFVILDLINLRSIRVDVEKATAWVEAGATIGEVFYTIAQNSRTLGFPGGNFPSVGVGGHFSGGGHGPLSRKYGLSCDNVIDARFIDVNGKILDRNSMGEDLFWAIRGGGAASFGVVVAWKIQLVAVPENVTVFQVHRTLEENALQLVHQWQYVVDNVPHELFLRPRMTPVTSSQNGSRTVVFTFDAFFQGGVNELLRVMNQSFPELGLVQEDCISMSWIQAVVHFAGYLNGEPPEVLLDRTSLALAHYKVKSDYVTEPIPLSGLEGMLKFFYERDAEGGDFYFNPYGGRISEIPESATPFPHRAGNLYLASYLVFWGADGKAASERPLSWITRLTDYMTPYVSMSPRRSYSNYRDLDLGVNDIGNTSYAQASIWGMKYFNNNFERLVQVKTRVDPANFFRNEQSIPPFFNIDRSEAINIGEEKEYI